MADFPVSPQAHNGNGTYIPNERAQEFIHRILDTALNEIIAHGVPAITLKQRPTGARFFINPTNGALEPSGTEADTYTTYSFPGKDAYEAWRFTIAVRVLAIIADALHSQLVISKRDIYYCDPAGFGSQRVVDDLIEDIAHTIGVNRLALNVEAAAKGLAVGCYCMKTRSHTIIDAKTTTEDILIPRLEDIDEIDISGVDWVLILEKEAVFHRLARGGYHTKAAMGRGILVTGKGYPDLCTRAFVRRLSDARASCDSRPLFYILVDGDPDGMAIMSTYKYGSKAHAHENIQRTMIPSCR
ncbi:hypothetical protein MAP00_003943 [Monascus purpureus]|nr:hypothetical protein MAP00_003943 [Monascus purpureus]